MLRGFSKISTEEFLEIMNGFADQYITVNFHCAICGCTYFKRFCIGKVDRYSFGFGSIEDENYSWYVDNEYVESAYIDKDLRSMGQLALKLKNGDMVFFESGK